jgi:hypothetical protein
MQTKYGQGFGTYDPLTGDFTWDKNTTNYSHSWGPILDGQDYTIGKNTYSGQKYDNFKDFFKIGINQDYNLSLQGGTDKVKTLFSLGYTNMTGIIPDNTFQRFSLRSTTNAQLTDIFHLEIGANLVNSGGNKSQKGSNVSGVSLPLYRMPVNYHGAQGAGDNAMYRTDYDNPFWSAKNIRYEDDVWRFVGSTKLSYDMDKSKRIFRHTMNSSTWWATLWCSKAVRIAKTTLTSSPTCCKSCQTKPSIAIPTRLPSAAVPSWMQWAMPRPSSIAVCAISVFPPRYSVRTTAAWA